MGRGKKKKKKYTHVYINVTSRGRSVGEEFELCESFLLLVRFHFDIRLLHK